jgi:MYXO-CTERM domain-containing protein
VDDPCSDVWCPPPRICIEGVCDDDPCAYINCPEGYVCVGDTCVDESTLTPDETPETDPDGSSGMEPQDVLATGAGGCAGCALAGERQGRAVPAAMALIVLLALVRRRR